MFSSRSGLRYPSTPNAHTLPSVFCDKVDRRHPLGNILAILSTLSGLILVLAVSI
ncbi:hypothetical protein WJT86_03190 [Microvirga sp. W0021]|uniref:Uncharacterized protein n=1 Tax=Hohaiivirga grylli TaxID=3133970 RepID=A0ABV0BGH7_9HYPH